MAKNITKFYLIAIEKANDDPKWTTFTEQLTALDDQIGSDFKEKADKDDFECNLTDISKKETL